jgi:hypothetical protein
VLPERPITRDHALADLDERAVLREVRVLAERSVVVAHDDLVVVGVLVGRVLLVLLDELDDAVGDGGDELSLGRHREVDRVLPRRVGVRRSAGAFEDLPSGLGGERKPAFDGRGVGGDGRVARRRKRDDGRGQDEGFAQAHVGIVTRTVTRRSTSRYGFHPATHASNSVRIDAKSTPSQTFFASSGEPVARNESKYF